MKGTRSIQILRCTRAGCKRTEDTVVSESGLRIVLVDSKGEVDFALIRTIIVDPESLIIGLLFTSRVINNLSDILELHVQNHLAKVTLADACEFREKLESLLPSARLILGVCGPDEGVIGSWRACDIPPVESSLKLAPGTITHAIKSLNQAMPIFRATGGTHGAAIADQKGNLLVIAEDVGRHNAVDRVIGIALQEGLNLSASMLVSSGRLTADLVLKAAVARLPILASISAAVTSGIELAEVAGVTLIGFVRGVRMNIYTHPERILFKTN